MLLSAAMAEGQEGRGFRLEQLNDTLSVLMLTTDSTSDGWRLPYPVYRFATGDVDGDGREDALVGVVKSTRYYPEVARRIFIFKNYHGLVRSLWLGSRLGGILQDFCFAGGRVRSLELTADSLYVVAEYRWQQFGLGFERFLCRNTGRDEALAVYSSGIIGKR